MDKRFAWKWYEEALLNYPKDSFVMLVTKLFSGLAVVAFPFTLLRSWVFPFMLGVLIVVYIVGGFLFPKVPSRRIFLSVWTIEADWRHFLLGLMGSLYKGMLMGAIIMFLFMIALELSGITLLVLPW